MVKREGVTTISSIATGINGVCRVGGEPRTMTSEPRGPLRARRPCSRRSSSRSWRGAVARGSVLTIIDGVTTSSL
jgi:hypothetical protein